MTNFTIHIVIWAVLATVVIFLAIYRRKVDTQVDDMVHIHDGEAGAVTAQAAVAKKVAAIDRWGKILTVLAVLYLLAIAGMYLYGNLTQESTRVG